jgi:hypothetical protein
MILSNFCSQPVPHCVFVKFAAALELSIETHLTTPQPISGGLCQFAGKFLP